MSLKRFIITTTISLCIAGILAIAAAGLYASNIYTQSGPLAQDTVIEIKKGSGVSSIAAQLHKENIISQPLIFRLTTQMSGDHVNIKAGEYKITAGSSMQFVLNQLVEGDVYLRMVTIPEGLTSWQVVQRLNQVDDLSGTIDEIPAEGSLLPETYSYSTSDTKSDVIERMKTAMSDITDKLWTNRSKNLPIKNKQEAIILASIIEKETSVPYEHGKVAGVFVNRLNIGMALQTDPTVIYALTKGKIQDGGQGPIGRRLLKKDLKIDSPYNTYMYPGLPPGPIANPGKASIEAALNPAQHEYFYFVANGTGGHAFAKTLKEHNNNVSKWRKIRRSQ